MCPGKEEQSWGAHNGVSTCGVTARKRGDGDRGSPGGVSTVSWQGYSRAGPTGGTDYKDVRWARGLKGTAGLLRGREAAARPRTGRARRGLPRDKGLLPARDWRAKGRQGISWRPGSGPLMPLRISWNLSRWAEQEPLGPAWPCPLPTSDRHSSLGAAGVAGKTGRRTSTGLRATRWKSSQVAKGCHIPGIQPHSS